MICRLMEESLRNSFGQPSPLPHRAPQHVASQCSQRAPPHPAPCRPHPSGLCLQAHNATGQHGVVYDPAGQCGHVHGRAGQCRLVQCPAGQCGVVYDLTGEYEVVHNPVGQCAPGTLLPDSASVEHVNTYEGRSWDEVGNPASEFSSVVDQDVSPGCDTGLALAGLDDSPMRGFNCIHCAFTQFFWCSSFLVTSGLFMRVFEFLRSFLCVLSFILFLLSISF